MKELESLVKIYSLLHQYKIQRSLGILNKELQKSLYTEYTTTLLGAEDEFFTMRDEDLSNLMKTIHYRIENLLTRLRTKEKDRDQQYLGEEIEVN